MAVDRSLKSFAVIALVMEVFFAIIYGFHEGYPAQVGYSDMNGLLVAVYLIMLLLVGRCFVTQVLDFLVSTSKSFLSAA
jgi:uncharacterized membrane protein